MNQVLKILILGLGIFQGILGVFNFLDIVKQSYSWVNPVDREVTRVGYMIDMIIFFLVLLLAFYGW